MTTQLKTPLTVLKSAYEKSANQTIHEVQKMSRWTDEARARQSALIHSWKPWEQSTGAKTAEGKRIVSLNSTGHYWRERLRFACWLAKQAEHLRQGRPLKPLHEVVAESRRRARKFGLYDGDD